MANNVADSIIGALPLSVQAELKSAEYTVKYPRKAQILRQRDNSKDIFYINYGKVRVTLYTEQGYRVSFIDIHPGMSFGELSAVDSMPRSANVTAVEDTSLIRISQQKFLELVKAHPSFALYVMQQMSTLIRRLNQRMYELTALDGKHRIYAELVRLAEEGEMIDGDIVIYNPPSQSEIAARINSHREAISRIYKKLQNEGILAKRSKQLIIKDVEALKNRIHAELMREA